MIWSLLRSLLSAFKTRRSLALENLALRQQLAVVQRSVKRPRLSNVDRGLWVLWRRVWTEWDSVLVHQARHRRALASRRVQTLLDSEEPEVPAGSTSRRSGSARAAPGHFPSQSAVGERHACTANSRSWA